MTWDDMLFWQTGEWDVIQEHLDDLQKAGTLFNPRRELLFAALDAVPLEEVKVCFIGQDPYPDRSLCTGIAFSIPKEKKPFPVTLANIFREYSTDLNYDYPKNGDLTPWCRQGVLLWNAIPTCQTEVSLSHRDWEEWTYLTKEIIEKLSARSIVFAFLGSVAREFVKYVNPESSVIETSHPSPRGQLNARSPFLGSRIFSTINDKLVEQGLDPVDWRL